MPKPLPSPEFLHKLLRYEPDTGKLFWRERPLDSFIAGKYSQSRKMNTWNKSWAGKEAFTYLSHGYNQGSILGRLSMAHRVIWALNFGEWPADQIDHINGVRNDNRIENLRSVTNRGNARNQKLKATNTSGFCGVVWAKGSRKWGAQITIDGRNVWLGLFDNKNDAAKARSEAETHYGFHENHGVKRP